jgi:Ca-activated chloride channel homolog
MRSVHLVNPRDHEPRRPHRLRRRRTVGALLALSFVGVAAACGDESTSGPSVTDPELIDPGNCLTVPMAVSSEKIDLLRQLADTFNRSGVEIAGQCVFVSPTKRSSGAAATLLTQGWPDPDTNGPAPVIWSPAASAWGAIVNERVDEELVPPGQAFMLTPLVIAMPKPMADALGYPATPIGFADIVALAEDPEGWARYGHPEWGAFKLGKTNPNFSTSGLNFTIAQYYAATGTTSGLTTEDLDRPEVEAFARAVESSVVHYGDITMTFLNNWFRADLRGTSLTYASAVAVEEKSVIDYNRGNPDGILDPGEEPRVPKVPLVAIYPEEGTLFSDNPLFILNAPWVSAEQRLAAEAFRDFVQLPENQQQVLAFGFRPGNPAVPVGDPIVRANGVDPAQPQAELAVPEPEVLVRILDRWAEQRKAARVLFVLDVSGSMGEPAAADSFATKLELAQAAAARALDQFKAEDEVGLWVFSTDLGPQADREYLELLGVAPVGETIDALRARIRAQIPTNGTPLYAATAAAYTAMRDSFEDGKINAIVLLTDGVNDDGDPADDEAALEDLITTLRAGTEGGGSKPVRIFPISYGEGADKATLRRIAEATNAALYDATNPATIDQVFTAVVSNF